MRLVVWSACLIAAASVAFATPPGKPIDHEEAIAEFTRAIENNPTDWEAYFFRGIHHEGVAHCLKGIKTCVKGQMTDKNDAYQKAIADFGKVIELGESLEAALTRRNLAPEGLPPEVKRQIDFTGMSYQYRGAIHAELKEYQKAIADFKAAIKTADIYPGCTDSFRAMGDIYRDLDETNRAIEAYDGAIERACHGSPAVFIERGKLYAKRGEREKALSDAKIACEWTPPHNDCGLLQSLQSESAKR
jgi:tetratricopeptide (TPR) repeat protein